MPRPNPTGFGPNHKDGSALDDLVFRCALLVAAKEAAANGTAKVIGSALCKEMCFSLLSNPELCEEIFGGSEQAQGPKVKRARRTYNQERRDPRDSHLA